MKKNLVALILIVSIISTAIYSPIFFAPPKAQAWVFSLVSKVAGKIAAQPMFDIERLAKALKDAVAMRLAQRMIDDMVKSSIAWANTGFEGNPAFATDLGSYIGDIANQEAGRYLNNVAGANLCSPFKPQIVLSLREYYNTKLGLNDNYSCTFTDISGNFQAFIDGDFDQGGWDSWFQLTQNSNNNPYQVYMTAQGELDRKIAARVNTELRKLDWGDGFKTKGGCLEYNSYINDEDPGFAPDNPPPIDGSLPVQGGRLKDENKGPNECIKFGPDTTPGTIIKGQLDKVLPSGLEKLITVEHAEQLIGAFAEGLLKRYVFGDKGLFSTDYNDHFNASSDGPTIPDQDICDGIICDPPATTTGGTINLNNPNNAITLFSSCSSDKGIAAVDETVTWSLTMANGSGTLPNDGSYTYSYTWSWGTDPNSASQINISQTKVTSSPLDSISLSFPSAGDYYAAIQANVSDASGIVASFSKICNVSNYGTPMATFLPVTVTSGSVAN